nr:hypothetical protein CFP56_62339 [Quercus suber]
MTEEELQLLEGASEIETGHLLSQEHEVGLLNQKASLSLDLEQRNLEAMSDVCNGQFFISSKVSIKSDSCFSVNKIDMRSSNNVMPKREAWVPSSILGRPIWSATRFTMIDAIASCDSWANDRRAKVERSFADNMIKCLEVFDVFNG